MNSRATRFLIEFWRYSSKGSRTTLLGLMLLTATRNLDFAFAGVYNGLLTGISFLISISVLLRGIALVTRQSSKESEYEAKIRRIVLVTWISVPLLTGIVLSLTWMNLIDHVIGVQISLSLLVFYTFFMYLGRHRAAPKISQTSGQLAGVGQVRRKRPTWLGLILLFDGINAIGFLASGIGGLSIAYSFNLPLLDPLSHLFLGVLDVVVMYGLIANQNWALKSRIWVGGVYAANYLLRSEAIGLASFRSSTEFAVAAVVLNVSIGIYLYRNLRKSYDN